MLDKIAWGHQHSWRPRSARLSTGTFILPCWDETFTEVTCTKGPSRWRAAKIPFGVLATCPVLSFCHAPPLELTLYEMPWNWGLPFLSRQWMVNWSWRFAIGCTWDLQMQDVKKIKWKLSNSLKMLKNSSVRWYDIYSAQIFAVERTGKVHARTYEWYQWKLLSPIKVIQIGGELLREVQWCAGHLESWT